MHAPQADITAPSRRRVLGVTLGVATAAALVPAGAAVAHDRPASAAPPIRQIPLQGAVNVRDLGGYRARYGGRVRYGYVYRADALGKLTDADVSALAGLGLRRSVDFRVPFEVQMDGADRLPPAAAAVARPISDGGMSAELIAAIGSKDPVRQEALLGGDRAAAMMRKVYRTFASDAAARAAFAQTLRDVARGDGPVLFHCTAGKDRTGWLAYVLLGVLGVSSRVAVADYLASNGFRAEADARTRAGLKQAGMMENPDLLIPVQEVRAEYLAAGLDQVRADFGSLERYVSLGLGLDRRDVALLRARLLD
ncbi:tyrosine-protein phosphatase [Streptomyces xanthii]|uniref:Tyrosine-protein phosphatase n=1 Tax=Streptomyces xanthii TaxID=2768069 RepID=A0A7H1BDL4_9ACTN|nr:tyrosine-protein phosphatase [Streptomyces xanthii]QNS06819.1 tyrosine-protein phosphatase [Streptomyces xanthii]